MLPSMQIALLFGLFFFTFVQLSATPPPPEQVTANCVEPTYASDMLVCEDAELRSLDGLLAGLINQGEEGAVLRDAQGDFDWFQRSRLCAFEADHRDCLMAAYCLRLALLNQQNVADCGQSPDGYMAVSDFSKRGFARHGKKGETLLDREIRFWGFVDYQNIYGDEEARKVLGDWWSGYGPDESTWRFNIKANARDKAGQSFAIYVPNDMLRDDILRIFLRNARQGLPTKVLLKGVITSFEAPANVTGLHGLSATLQSSRDIHLQVLQTDG